MWFFSDWRDVAKKQSFALAEGPCWLGGYAVTFCCAGKASLLVILFKLLSSKESFSVDALCNSRTLGSFVLYNNKRIEQSKQVEINIKWIQNIDMGLLKYCNKKAPRWYYKTGLLLGQEVEDRFGEAKT